MSNRGAKRGKAPTTFTDAQLEETRQQMLAMSYEDIKRDFLQAVAESKEPKRRRRLQ